MEEMKEEIEILQRGMEAICGHLGILIPLGTLDGEPTNIPSNNDSLPHRTGT